MQVRGEGCAEEDLQGEEDWGEDCCEDEGEDGGLVVVSWVR